MRGEMGRGAEGVVPSGQQVFSCRLFGLPLVCGLTQLRVLAFVSFLLQFCNLATHHCFCCVGRHATPWSLKPSIPVEFESLAQCVSFAALAVKLAPGLCRACRDGASSGERGGERAEGGVNGGWSKLGDFSFSGLSQQYVLSPIRMPCSLWFAIAQRAAIFIVAVFVDCATNSRATNSRALLLREPACNSGGV